MKTSTKEITSIWQKIKNFFSRDKTQVWECKIKRELPIKLPAQEQTWTFTSSKVEKNPQK